ncbi:MAG: head-tail connector protein [Micavibrio aeruginosavorus]|uniref:Head-tail connector protein n=1 Tax=Micavibrio aeruginosavorus TaxID=349221 RepID=A0A7T5R241_9BACT|nr:MAG: head-tail connector protein [Micavibrio aeruginosavorus]
MTVSKQKAAPIAAAEGGGAHELIARYERARQRRRVWESLWQESYEYALPQRNSFAGSAAGQNRMEKIYDGTALDAVDSLAASLLGHLTPPWTQWFGFKPGPDLSPAETEALSPLLEQAARTLQAHFDRSNFMVEMHQCYLDLIVGGTAALVLEESEPGAASAFRFSAVPLSDIVLEEGAGGMLDGSYRQMALTLAQIQRRYPAAMIPEIVMRTGAKDAQARFDVLEAVLPAAFGQYEFTALLHHAGDEPCLLRTASFSQSPVIAFRWLKAPGELYGRSPVMKALPDIKTANKVVELILKNASIAVTGIWQADDDGVLNPANIELTPGTIIPKAVGSAGLKPLEMPGRFDISQLVLEDLRRRVRHALLADKLAPVASPRMTATEVIERSAEMSLLLGATYGRLQAELLTPLVQRALAILRRRGEVPDIRLDGRLVALDHRAPLARAQGQRNIQNTLSWIESVLRMGPEAVTAIDLPAAARFLGEALGVPVDLIRQPLPLPEQETTDVLPQTV